MSGVVSADGSANGSGNSAALGPDATWVLLRGLTRERRHWGAFTDTFATRLEAARVIALDLPGNGALHAERSPARVDAMAAAARAELQRRGIVPPYRLLAMSLGAMVALEWAARWPDEVAAAVLINTSLRPFSPAAQRLRPRAFVTLVRLLLTRPGPLATERTVLHLTSARAAQHAADVLTDWARWRHESPISAGNALRQLAAAARYRAPREVPAVPLLVLHSAADTLVDPRCSARLAARWQLPIVTHPWAGHDLPLDDGDWVAAEVMSWLRSLDATR